jgi:hypothetical protein
MIVARAQRLRGTLRHEKGGVLVLGAVMLPVFLLLSALVFDVGQWYTHKRQLQNRADAAAYAAGVEYAELWQACVQPGDPSNAANRIADAARQFAGNPDATEYATGALPGQLFNTEIASQATTDIVINSTSYDDDSYEGGDDNDYSDGATGDTADPCYFHEDGDDISAPGYWTDVKVMEHDLPSLFGQFGLPLDTNRARARVEIRPSISQDGLLPLAVPNNIIVKAQVRYYDECRNTLLATRDLAPLPAADQEAYQGVGGGTLWGLPSGTDPDVGDPGVGFGLAVPGYSGCNQPYLPIGVEVRIASRDEIDLDASCATLAASRFADCFRRLSQIRVWNDASVIQEPRVQEVVLTGGCAANADAYFGPLPVGATECSYGANVAVDWGDRAAVAPGNTSNFSVEVNGVTAIPPGGGPTGIWTIPAGTLDANPGSNTVSVEVDWVDTTATHSYQGQACRTGNQNPCRYDGPVEAVHRTFVGTTTTAGAVELVRSSGGPSSNGLPGLPLDNIADGGATVQIYPTIGIRSVLKPGQLVTLRLDDPQANQTLRCDPDYAQGQEFSAFRTGCKPWYGENTFDDPTWWNAGTQQCPRSSTFFFYGSNSPTAPWECVPTAPGLSPPVIGEGFSVATDNCSNINNNSCQQTMCMSPAEYQNWLAGTDAGARGSLDPRIVNLFIIPYQSLKGSTGGDPEETVPVIGFAAFYVLAWGGNNSNRDPCPDLNPFPGVTIPQPPPGSVVGIFRNPVFIGGPVDPEANCVVDQLRACRAVLVR